MRRLLLRLSTFWVATLCAAAASATTAPEGAPPLDVNTASEAQLDGVRGIGPGLSGRILGERGRAPFKDWADFVARVGGVGAASAARLSGQGLTVNGHAYPGAIARKAASRAAAPSDAGASRAAAPSEAGASRPAAPPEAGASRP